MPTVALTKHSQKETLSLNEIQEYRILLNYLENKLDILEGRCIKSNNADELINFLEK